MKAKILKYRLKITDEQFVEMPKNHQILSAQSQSGELCIWALVEPSSPIENVKILIFGTGFEIDYPGPESDTEYNFIDTVQMDCFVWHVFEVRKTYLFSPAKVLGSSNDG